MATASGTNPLPRQIQNTQTSAEPSDYDASHIICGFPNPDDIQVKGNVTFVNPIAVNLVGSMQMYCSNVVPAGYLECNGASISRITYADLFAVIGTRFGSDSATTFNLPETRGLFVRGWNNTNTQGNFYDQDAASRVAIKTGGITGNNVGSYQTDQFQAHFHNISATYNAPSLTIEPIRAPLDELRQYCNGTTNNLINTATSDTGGNETRPMNVYCMYIIKF